MLFLIASAPDTKEFKRAYELAKDMGADICLLQNAVYALRVLHDNSVYFLRDELLLRGIGENETKGKVIDYKQLVDLICNKDKVIGLF